MRKKYFKTYCEFKNRYDILMKQNDYVETEETKKIKQRLNKGLLGSSNKLSKFRKILELFWKDRWAYLEKRRLLSLYQSIWGTSEWNQVK